MSYGPPPTSARRASTIPPVEETDTLHPGDTVRLKVGGPLMTTLSVEDDHCCCMWFSDRGSFEHGRFELDVVELVQREVRLLA